MSGINELLKKAQEAAAAKNASTGNVAPTPASSPVLAPQKQASVIPKINVDSFMSSAKQLAGMAASKKAETPEEQQQITAMNHEQIKENIAKMEALMGSNHPMIPQLLIQIKRILLANNQLVLELSEEDIGKISRGMYEASNVAIATAATAKAKGKKTYQDADLF